MMDIECRGRPANPRPVEEQGFADLPTFGLVTLTEIDERLSRDLINLWKAAASSSWMHATFRDRDSRDLSCEALVFY